MTTLYLSQEHRAQIASEARAAFPRECCGLIEGMREGDAVHVAVLHAARNLSSDGDRFEIDPADHFKAVRAARANGHVIVGCYHSHPNGRIEPSKHDGNSDAGYLWVIAAVDELGCSIAAYLQDSGWHTLAIDQDVLTARQEGA